jgi:prepilin-type N-terminal cleavage/methylation domain-containing protein
MKKEKKNKKKNQKFSLKKYLKGFTLVELLAVIVILAIIMLIAIPNVLNVTEQAKQKSFINYCQKILKTAEEVYVKQSSVEAIIRPSENTFVAYDVQKDLGLPNAGDYYGTVFIRINDYQDKNYSKILMVGNSDYMLYYDEGKNEKLDINLLQNVSTYKAMLAGKGDVKDIVNKEVYSAYELSKDCNYFDDSVVDGATNTQQYCTNNSHKYRLYTNEAGETKCDLSKNETVLFLETIDNYYNNKSKLSNCHK